MRGVPPDRLFARVLRHRGLHLCALLDLPQRAIRVPGVWGDEGRRVQRLQRVFSRAVRQPGLQRRDAGHGVQRLRHVFTRAVRQSGVQQDQQHGVQRLRYVFHWEVRSDRLLDEPGHGVRQLQRVPGRDVCVAGLLVHARYRVPHLQHLPQRRVPDNGLRPGLGHGVRRVHSVRARVLRQAAVQRHERHRVRSVQGVVLGCEQQALYTDVQEWGLQRHTGHSLQRLLQLRRAGRRLRIRAVHVSAGRRVQAMHKLQRGGGLLPTAMRL